MSSTTATNTRLDALLPLLCCPACRGPLNVVDSALHCAKCARSYPVRGGVPILLPDGMPEPGVGTISADDPVSRHPYSPAALEIIQEHSDGWVLDLGAGGKLSRFDNVLQIDIFRYPKTDVVGTADRLPFRDNAFKAVISQAVFEHLQYPEWAASEIRRVLQPGGVAKIDTAFLQPEHGYPHHYFNASETGLKHWFREFDIRWSGVEPYQHPKWSLSWFLGVYLDRIDAPSAAVLRAATLDQVLGALERSGDARQESSDAPLIDALDALPVHAQRILAAGVSVYAINPPKIAASESQRSLESDSQADSSATTRKLALARTEIELLVEQQTAMRERHILGMDRTRYLHQFYPGRASAAHLGFRAWLQFRLVALLRATLPRTVWFRLRRAAMHRRQALQGSRAVRGSRPQPFVSIVVDPRDSLALIDTFFSLVRQTHSDWELILLQTVDQDPATRHGMHAFARLDERVRLIGADLGGESRKRRAKAEAKGEFILCLPEGATMSFDAIHHFVTLARNRPQTHAITADFEHGDLELGEPLRCYNASPDLQAAASQSEHGWFVLQRCGASESPGTEPSAERCSPHLQEAAHIPRVLFRATHIPLPLT